MQQMQQLFKIDHKLLYVKTYTILLVYIQWVISSWN